MADRSSGAVAAQGSCGCGAIVRHSVWSRASLLERAQIRSFPCTFAGPTLTRKSGTEIQGKWTVPAGDMIHGGNLFMAWLSRSRAIRAWSLTTATLRCE